MQDGQLEATRERENGRSAPQSHGTWAVAMRLLHTTCSRRRLTSGLGGELLTGRLSARRLACGLLGTCHGDEAWSSQRTKSSTCLRMPALVFDEMECAAQLGFTNCLFGGLGGNECSPPKPSLGQHRSRQSIGQFPDGVQGQLECTDDCFAKANVPEPSASTVCTSSSRYMLNATNVHCTAHCLSSKAFCKDQATFASALGFERCDLAPAR